KRVYACLCYTSPTVTLSSHCSDNHRHLHSFPTRRSSDLSAKSSLRARPYGRRARRGSCRSTRLCGSTTADPDSLWGRDPIDATRSEEHTSELQSRFDLVCRLLLEKKKFLLQSVSVYSPYS